ncbi:MAG: hypothetical protein O3B01_14595 [Planctomycetota bacterium]|nr:hypothetical protein [Planctomycetota bacterium]MDA1139801.1 hypothetical protein [Planctomycetota bacterium]
MNTASFIYFAHTLIVSAPLVAEEDSAGNQYRLMIASLEFVLKLESKELANRQLIRLEDELSDLEGKIANSKTNQATHRIAFAEEALNKEDRGRLLKQINEEEELTKTLRKSLAEENELKARRESLAMSEAKTRVKSLGRAAEKLLSQKSQQEEWTWESVEKKLRQSAELPEKTGATTTERIQELKEILAKAELSSKASTTEYENACKRMETRARLQSQLDIFNARLDRKRRNVNRQHPATIDYLMARNPQTQQVTGFLDRGKAWNIRCRLCEKLLRDYIAMLQSKITFVKKCRSLFPEEVEGTAEDYSTAQKLLKWIQRFDTIAFQPPEVVTL